MRIKTFQSLSRESLEKEVNGFLALNFPIFSIDTLVTHKGLITVIAFIEKSSDADE